MTPKKNEEDSNVCNLHSGMSTWQKGIAALLLALCAMHAYSTFKQLPDLRFDVAQNISAINMHIDKLEYRLSSLERETANIKAQRNLDHPNTTPLR